MAFFSLQHLLQLLHIYGYPALAGIVALECVGLPLPGEAMLIAAAVLAATTGQMSIALVVLSAAVGAIFGQLLGYWIGLAVGFRLLRRYGRYIGLNDRRLAYGRALFGRHGVKVVIASRFVVLLRALAGLLAGANHMPLSRFVLANVVGSVAWAALYGFGAYALGHEARHVAGPAAITIGVVVAAALVAGGLYVRRREHALLYQGPAGRPRPERIPVPSE
jgi:membrane protein DedA with SNARE-associated domain